MNEDIKAELTALVPRLRRFAHAISGNPHDGDDLVQTACVKALSRLDRYRRGTRLDSWMFRIIQNTHIDVLRGRTRRGETPAAVSPEELSDGRKAADQSEHQLLLERVRRAMAALPDDHRRVLALVAIEGHSYKEAAEALEVPVGTVMSRLARARARLHTLIEEGSS